jgi:hypothetical protein
MSGSVPTSGPGGGGGGANRSSSGGSAGGAGYSGQIRVTYKFTPQITAWPTASAITYGQALSASTLSGGSASVPGTFAFTTSSTYPTEAGTYSASVTFTPSDTTYYASVSGSVNVTVDKKALTTQGTLSGGSKVYDGTTTATPSGSAQLQAAEPLESGSIADGRPYTGDDVSLSGTASYAFNSKGVASATAITSSGLSLSGAQANHYTLTAPTLSANITKKPLQVTGLAAHDKFCDGTTAATLTGTASLLTMEGPGFGTGDDFKPYTGDTISLTWSDGSAFTGSFASAAVGDPYAVTVTGNTLTGTQAGNYKLAEDNEQPGLAASILTTTVSSGMTQITAAAPSGSNPNITVSSGGTLVANNGISSGSINGNGTITVSGKLTGTGTVGTVVVNSGGVVQPGNSLGQINSGNETWNGGGSYVWEINDATGTAGSSTAGWSLLNVTGGIDVQATMANPFVIKPTSLSGATHFNNGNGYAWTMATVSGSITHFDPAKFIVNTNDFKNDMYLGKFSVQLSSDGKSVQLKFTPSCAGGLTTKSYEVVGDPDLGAMHLYFANPFGLADVTATRLDYASMTGNAYDSGGSLVGSVNSGSPLVKNSTYPLDSRATRLELIAYHDGGTESWVNALVRDKQGTAAYWDPVMATLTFKQAGVLRKTFTRIPSAEHYVRVENGKPGLAWVALLVNDHLFVVDPLLAGEGVEVDVSSSMLPGEQNTVVVAGEGPVGAMAFVLIGDSRAGQVRVAGETTGAEASDWRGRIAQGYEDASSLVLAVRREGGWVVLSWPGEQTGCVVQAWRGSAPDLGWVDLAVRPELVAGRFMVTLEVGEPLRLFRLYRP